MGAPWVSAGELGGPSCVEVGERPEKRQEPASEPAPRVLYVCGECGRDVDIHNDITFGRTVDHLATNDPQAGGSRALLAGKGQRFRYA